MSLSNPVNSCGSSSVYTTSPASGGLSFTNLGSVGARVYKGTVSNVVQFRRILQGNNIAITEEANDIKLDVNDLLFSSTNPITRNTPGMLGVVLGKTTVLDTLHELLYPVTAPILSLTLAQSTTEYGDTSNVQVNWGVVKTSETILTIVIAWNSGSGSPGTVTGNSQSGVLFINKEALVNTVVTLTVTTATQTVNISGTVTIGRKIRYGQTVKDGTIAPILDADITALSGAFETTATLSPRIITVDASKYLIFAIPASLGATPTFKVNGLVNNAFTLVRSSSYTNSFGYAEATNVWVSNSFATGTLQIEIV